ncbi:MAG: hypothetical protein U9N34_07150 [Candidatus Cloacimonadota bacterium]|nr:hypothetical protein [Candidatus Cloacimonadota bacterium]
MNSYIDYVTNYPIITAMIQFAILGTLGEFVSKWIISKKVYIPFKPLMVLWKMIEWAILAFFIKYAFVGIKGFLQALVEHNMLPIIASKTGWKPLYAFTISVLVNLQFGLFLVIFHRILDNLFLTVKNWAGLDKALFTLIWFWIPAHTVTFSLPKVYQIGLAALWSVVMGTILGYFNKRKID